jgi:hypothetical protein
MTNLIKFQKSFKKREIIENSRRVDSVARMTSKWTTFEFLNESKNSKSPQKGNKNKPFSLTDSPDINFVNLTANPIRWLVIPD